MSTEHDKLVEDCARAIYEKDHSRLVAWDQLEKDDQPRIDTFRNQARAALAIAVERCAAECRKVRDGYDNEWNHSIGKARDIIEATEDCEEAIRALLSPNDRGEA